MNSKLINLELWKDFYDNYWRIKVIFWRWEVARFKIYNEEALNFIDAEREFRPLIERVKKGNY